MRYFKDRLEAADQLAERLAPLQAKKPLILAIPRGAVPMGERLARALDGELDVVLVRKLSTRDDPELAMGALAEGEAALWNGAMDELGLDAQERKAELEEAKKLLALRRSLLTPGLQPISPAGRQVIVLDDGAATGATLCAALMAVRKKAPAGVHAAVAVAPTEALQRFTELADSVTVLKVPDNFYAVGDYFADFRPVSDEEVVACLERARERAAWVERRAQQR